MDINSAEHPHIVALALVLWEYNVSPLEQMKTVYGPNYQPSDINHKLNLIKKGLKYWLGELDHYHQDKLIEAALQKYGNEAHSELAYYYSWPK